MKNKDITQTPTITAGIYSAGDAVGGLLTFANAVSVYKGDGKIVKIVVIDDAMQNANLILHLFDRTFTAMADNAAWSPSDADMQNSIGHVEIAVADYQAGVNNSHATVLVDMGFALVSGGTSLFGQLECVATPTYVATDDLTIKVTIER